MTKKLDRAEMLAALRCVFEPAGKGLSSEEINEQLLLFCANCPDPVSAMDLVLEVPVGTTAHEVLEQALAMTPRSVTTWPESDLASDHPLRLMTRDMR
jgi:hypothetical protein